jgi:hypothetical protein
MTSPAFNLSLGIGVVFGILAAMMAYLITYNEWISHYSTKKEPRRTALEAAIYTFFIFFFMSLIARYLLA